MDDHHTTYLVRPGCSDHVTILETYRSVKATDRHADRKYAASCADNSRNELTSSPRARSNIPISDTLPVRTARSRFRAIDFPGDANYRI